MKFNEHVHRTASQMLKFMNEIFRQTENPKLKFPRNVQRRFLYTYSQTANATAHEASKWSAEIYRLNLRQALLNHTELRPCWAGASPNKNEIQTNE